MEKSLNYKYFIALSFFIIGLITSAYQNKNGTAIPTGDSGSNLISSQSILNGRGHAWPSYVLENDGMLVLIKSEKNTVWPPLTAALVASLRFLGLSQSCAVFVFTTFFAGLTLACCFLFAFEVTKSIQLSTLSTITFFSFWGFQYWISKSYMPEGLYISMTLIIGLYFINVIKNGGTFWKFILLGVLTSSTYYVKSAAPAFIISVALSVFLYFMRSGFVKSFRQSTGFVIGAFMGAFPWLYRNIMIGTIGGSGVAGDSPVLQSVLSFFRLFIPYHGAYFENNTTLLGLAFFILIISILGFIFMQKSGANFFFSNVKMILKKPSHLLSISYFFSFLGVIFIAIFIIPKASHIEMRYWLEIYPFWVPVLLAMLSNLYSGYDKQTKNIIKGLSFVLFTFLVSFNLRETAKNFKKEWTIVRSESEQLAFRKALSNTFPNNRITYFSNYGNELFAQSGLSYWDTRDSLASDNQLQVFLHYRLNNKNEMTLGDISAPPPMGWKKYGTITDFDIYSP